MSREVLDFAIKPTGFSVHRVDRIPDRSGKSKGGGVCFMINSSWYDRKNVHPIQSLCSPDLEYLMLLCRPFRLPREFTAVIITAVYIPPQADTDAALKELYGHLCKQEMVQPDAAFIITGDFNKADFRRIALKFFQHISCNACGDRILDHCYSPFRNAYKSLPHPPLGKTDHASVLLLHAYREKLIWETPALRTIQLWLDQLDSVLQDCFDYVDWDVFWTAYDDDIDVYTDTVTCFIRKCTEDIVPTKTIRTYPNQKLWINTDVHAALNA